MHAFCQIDIFTFSKLNRCSKNIINTFPNKFSYIICMLIQKCLNSVNDLSSQVCKNMYICVTGGIVYVRMLEMHLLP